MPWYYANNNHRLGPVSDAEFARLVRENIITGETLVWRHGMPDWKSYVDVASELPPPTLAATPTAVAEPMSAREPLSGFAKPALDYASFWARLGAKLVDLLVLNFLVMFAAKAFGVWHEPPPAESWSQLFKTLGEMRELARVAFVVCMVYQWFFLRLLAATPGKLLFRIKVVRPDGSRLSNLQVLARPFAEFLNQFTLYTGYLVAAFDEEKRAMHDYLCRTRVVRKSRE
ncbi:MAG: RDD family protein [Nibricoccus sp.]